MAKKKLLDEVSDIARFRHLSLRTEQAYRNWIKRYIFFHDKRHPRDLDAEAVRAFLTHLAVNERVSASTQNQAFNALLFLYRKVLKIESQQGRTAVYQIFPGKRGIPLSTIIKLNQVRIKVAVVSTEVGTIRTKVAQLSIRVS